MGGRVFRHARGIPTATVRAGDADNNLRSFEQTPTRKRLRPVQVRIRPDAPSAEGVLPATRSRTSSQGRSGRVEVRVAPSNGPKMGPFTRRVDESQKLRLIPQDQAELGLPQVGLGRFELRASPPGASRTPHGPSLLSGAPRLRGNHRVTMRGLVKSVAPGNEAAPRSMTAEPQWAWVDLNYRPHAYQMSDSRS